MNTCHLLLIQVSVASYIPVNRSMYLWTSLCIQITFSVLLKNSSGWSEAAFISITAKISYRTLTVIIFGFRWYLTLVYQWDLDLTSAVNELHSKHPHLQSWHISSVNSQDEQLLLWHLKSPLGARSGTVGWGTTLQARRSRVRFLMVSLEFFIDIILPATVWSWDRLSL